MPLFHPRVIEKHTKAPKALPDAHAAILSAWGESLAKGTFDRETSHDGEFIQRILINVLGYTGSSAGAHWTVGKNQPVGSGNVDVALGHFSADSAQIVAPFELKGAKTRDLDAIMPGRNKSPVQQAWEYAMDAKGAKWVLVSNYREIRLYGKDCGRKDYEKFDLSQLTDLAQYARFMLLLSAENLLGERVSALLKESENKDKEITGKLYQDYKTLRARMIDTLTKDNPAIPPLQIIEHTQTILDRILFVAFAEDRGLLPDDTLKSCYEDRGKWNPQPAWENFKGLFGYIDKGNPPAIPGYNGGLFAQNNALNALRVSDALCEGFKTIGSYDFDSDVSVNILGHIFEQSITDLEEIKANLSGTEEELDRKKSKRKKDGIFYTPAYITRYIVEQAVGGWLNDRKKEIGFDKLPVLQEEDYASIQSITRGARKGTVTYNAKIEKHIKAWEAYKEVLSHIKVLDPACGSGAFLNEVFDYLYREGQAVNSQLTELNAGQAKLFRWDTHILANNIYGVDINRESVEITKLSLWLKTANRGEKLTYLDGNIKCGNSLIDDPAIDAAHAFRWEKEFPDIMKAGGFDVVVGNPPWGAAIPEQQLERIKQHHAEIIVRMIDSYMFFISQAARLTKQNGYNGWVVPDAILYQVDNANLRGWLEKTCQIRVVLNVGDAFDDVSRPCAITVFKHADKQRSATISIGDVSGTQDKTIIFNSDSFQDMPVSQLAKLPNHIWPTKNLTGYKILSKCKNALKEALDDDGIQRGVSPDLKDAFIADHAIFEKNSLEQDYIRKTVTGGEDVRRFYIRDNNKALLYITKETNPQKIPRIISYITKFKDRITCTEVAQGKHPLHALHRARDENIFVKQNKIIGVITGDRIITAIDKDTLYPTDGLYLMASKKEFSPSFMVALLNSKLATYCYRLLSGEIGRTLSQVKPKVLEDLPFVCASAAQQQPFIEKAEIMLARNKELHDVSSKFLALLKAEFSLEKPGEKLEQWYTLDFAAFTAELTKKKIVLSLAQKAEWMEHFEKRKATAAALKSTIDATDRDIDQMVYALYGLTPDEIAIVERA